MAADDVSLPVVEIFASIQGEGKLAGLPSTFVRLAGCPVRCSWCDTKRAWSAAGAGKLTAEDILARVAELRIPAVVVTGGEPLIHAGVAELVRRLRRLGHHVTVETSGVVCRRLTCDLISVSPKFTDRGVCRVRPARLRRLLALGQDYQVKFVVGFRRDFEAALRLLDVLGDLDRRNVLLMPKSATRAGYLRTAPRVARWALEHGLRFSPRLHLVLGLR